MGYYPAQIYFGIHSNGLIYQKESIQNRNMPVYNVSINLFLYYYVDVHKFVYVCLMTAE